MFSLDGFWSILAISYGLFVSVFLCLLVFSSSASSTWFCFGNKFVTVNRLEPFSWWVHFAFAERFLLNATIDTCTLCAVKLNSSKCQIYLFYHPTRMHILTFKMQALFFLKKNFWVGWDWRVWKFEPRTSNCSSLNHSHTRLDMMCHAHLLTLSRTTVLTKHSKTDQGFHIENHTAILICKRIF